MVYPNGGDVRHADGDGRSNSGVAGYDAVSSIDQNRIDEAKLSDAGCNLFDLSGCVCVRGLFARGASLRGSSYLMVSALTMPPTRAFQAISGIANQTECSQFWHRCSHFRSRFSQLFSDPRNHQKCPCHGRGRPV